MTLSRLALVLFSVALVIGCAAQAQTASSARHARASIPIKYVFVIVQENRTFDNVFGGIRTFGGVFPSPYPGAESVIPPSVAASMKPQPFSVGGPSNSYNSFECVATKGFTPKAWEDLENGKCAQGPTSDTVFRYLPWKDRSIYWNIAQQYGLGDAFFAAGAGGSFPGHQYIVAARSQMLPGPSDPPSPTTVVDQPAYQGGDYANGCVDSGSNPTIEVPMPLPSAFASPMQRSFAGECYPWNTFADTLQNNVPWKHYNSNPQGVFNGFINSSRWYKQISGWESSQTSLLGDIANTTGGNVKVGQFNWVKPPCVLNSDHPGASNDDGPIWVASVINAIGNNPYLWNQSAVFVIWDDWGGYYDHLTPPKMRPDRGGPGMRIPLLVVSPYTRKDLVVHTRADYGAILKFVENSYGLPPLTSLDKNAASLNGFFNFTATPRPFTPIASPTWTPAMCKGSPRTVED